MSGVCGFLGGETEPAVLDAMIGAACRQEGICSERTGEASYAVAACGATTTFAAGIRRNAGWAIHGHPYFEDADRHIVDIRMVAEAFCDAAVSQGPAALAALHGDFALAVIYPARRYALLAVDRMNIRNLVYTANSSALVFGPGCDVIARHPAVRQDVDPQQLFNYVHFHMVPGPVTAFRNHFRVPPGHYVEYSNGAPRVVRYWRM